MERTPFRFCPKCHNKYPYTDQHLVCNLCLSPEHKEDTSVEENRDQRARRLQMASAPTGQGRFEEEEETFSIQESDSDELDPEETPKTVSKTSKHKTHEKTTKAQGTPPPTGHGLTRKIGDQSSAPKKGMHVAKSSDSGRDTATQQSRARDSGSEQIRHRDSGTEMVRHRDTTTPKIKKVSSEPKKTTEKISIPKHPASEPKTGSYTEEQGLSSQMQRHKFGEELESVEPDYTQRRLHIQKDTGKISTLPPIKMKRRLAFQEKDKQLRQRWQDKQLHHHLHHHQCTHHR
ncbi:hypothetical protein NDU88_001690 [Pleurodeles waltl]|uniref:Uncharacterized protein n=1 Tax=Pleurodeles waltl TaxID=8319 RepID=A0AAV7U7K3_PLEWA|nr:hypothetical protein NDU88_001690 [Pleurodeles waltl]